MKVLLFLFLSLFITGCVNQPQKIGTSMYPQVEVKNENIQELKNKLIQEMSKIDFSLFSSNDFMLDFRKPFKDGEDTFGRAMMQAADKSDIDFKGVDFTLYTINGTTTIKGKPYLFKTFRYGSKTEKVDMSNNSNYYNSVQNILNQVK